MKASDIIVGGVYIAWVNRRHVPVVIERETHWRRGRLPVYEGRNLATGRALRISSGRLRRPATAEEIERTKLGRAGAEMRANIAAGFYDEEGVFHPIRASWDYDPRRVGEPLRYKKRVARKRRKRR